MVEPQDFYLQGWSQNSVDSPQNWPPAILQRISQYLASSKDCLEFSLTHPDWTPYGLDTLWTCPKFKYEEALLSFLRLAKSKRHLLQKVVGYDMISPTKYSYPTHLSDSDNSEVTKIYDLLFFYNFEQELEDKFSIANTKLADPNILVNLAKISNNLRKLAFYGYNITDNHLSFLSRICQNLTCIEIVGFPDTDLKLLGSFFKSLKSLTSLTLKSSNPIPDIVWNAIESHPHLLTSIDLFIPSSSPGLISALLKCTGLINLRISGGDVVFGQNILKTLISNNPGLKSIHIKSSDIDFQDLYTILESCSNLYHLELINPDIPRNSPVPDIEFSVSCYNLQHLILDGIELSKKTYSRLFGHFKFLKTIVLANLSRLSSGPLTRLSQISQCILGLYIYNCPGINDSFLIPLADKHSNSLLILHIKGLPIESVQLLQNKLINFSKVKILKIIGEETFKKTIEFNEKSHLSIANSSDSLSNNLQPNLPLKRISNGSSFSQPMYSTISTPRPSKAPLEIISPLTSFNNFVRKKRTFIPTNSAPNPEPSNNSINTPKKLNSDLQPLKSALKKPNSLMNSRDIDTTEDETDNSWMTPDQFSMFMNPSNIEESQIKESQPNDFPQDYEPRSPYDDIDFESFDQDPLDFHEYPNKKLNYGNENYGGRLSKTVTFKNNYSSPTISSDQLASNSRPIYNQKFSDDLSDPYDEQQEDFSSSDPFVDQYQPNLNRRDSVNHNQVRYPNSHSRYVQNPPKNSNHISDDSELDGFNPNMPEPNISRPDRPIHSQNQNRTSNNRNLKNDYYDYDSPEEVSENISNTPRSIGPNRASNNNAYQTNGYNIFPPATVNPMMNPNANLSPGYINGINPMFNPGFNPMINPGIRAPFPQNISPGYNPLFNPMFNPLMNPNYGIGLRPNFPQNALIQVPRINQPPNLNQNFNYAQKSYQNRRPFRPQTPTYNKNKFNNRRSLPNLTKTPNYNMNQNYNNSLNSNGIGSAQNNSRYPNKANNNNNYTEENNNTGNVSNPNSGSASKSNAGRSLSIDLSGNNSLLGLRSNTDPKPVYRKPIAFNANRISQGQNNLQNNSTPSHRNNGSQSKDNGFSNNRENGNSMEPLNDLTQESDDFFGEPNAPILDQPDINSGSDAVILELSVETPNMGCQSLVVRKGDDILKLAQEFCTKHKMAELEEGLHSLITTKLERKGIKI
ncbi:hypothetical protein AYI68_g1775 [Smittium mucronatum]|uniref:RNI-like protein n=1 Tax=Smittium mucronatum TaxID=133383 RepID=A0A1R0H4M4_9FUNG|nr:hypothetical protein AYI68_g1775 [Smittium mucronatum]